MYNILLTDDEQIVIDSLSMILSKNFEGQITLFSASSGTKALEIARSSGIDIIFMDIHMPGMNGLETISLIKKINPNIVIIILSAYDQFQYAQEALNLGAFKYLTKPVNRNLIAQTAREAMNQVDSERGKLTDSIELRQKLSVVSTMVESDFIYSCVFNNKGTDFSEYLNYFGIEGLPYFFACIEVSEVPNEKRYDVYVKIRDVLSTKCRCVTGSFMGDRIGVFFPLVKNESPEDLIKEIHTLLATKISGKIKIGASEIERDIKNAQNAYNSASACLAKIEESGVAFSGKANGQNESKDSESVLVEKAAAKLILAVKTGNVSATESLAKEYCELLYKAYEGQDDKIKGSLFESLVKERSAASQANSNYKDQDSAGDFSFFAKANEREELEKYFLGRSTECAKAASAAKDSEENPIVQKARQYIDGHLKDLPSLEGLADILGVSPFYLSKLFKEETGETYINYVTTARLEKARRLLSDGALIIKEISADIGYNDQNYFSKLFRQKYGETPSEYRQKMLGSGSV
ncbi:MAG: response regulator [Treponema sp.]|nr:response regulator [Treponema sp.]